MILTPTQIKTQTMMNHFMTKAKVAEAFLSWAFEKKNGSAAYLKACTARFMKIASFTQLP